MYFTAIIVTLYIYKLTCGHGFKAGALTEQIIALG